jgi:hypothetical protein
MYKFVQIIKTGPDTWEVRDDKDKPLKKFTGPSSHRQAEFYATTIGAGYQVEYS